MSQSTNNLATYIWSLADLLRGDFKQSQYGRIILPFTVNERSKLTRFQRLILTRLSDGKAPRRAALI
ncbi:MAG TPA: type I restriction-modification system subunit M N-terminal domain-containing protein [Roseovarius sp.]